MEPNLITAVFSAEAFLPAAVFDEITELRIRRAALVELEARRRKKRTKLIRDGKLVLVAVDHPARGVTRIRDDELAMGDRYQLLARTRCVLADPDLDGVVASSDVVDELFLLNYLERQRTGRSFLDRRVLVGSMNRGGLEGTAFEMEATFTSITAERLAQLRCDGGKMLYRLDPSDPASGRTILACAHALNSLRRYRLAAFLEPLDVTKQEGQGYHTQKEVATLVRQCGMAAALGESSSHVWLKLPYCDGFARVGQATTLPILLLGGPARDDPWHTLRDFKDGLDASARVRGAIIGRNLLFPAEGSPLPMCRALTSMVHHGASLEKAVAIGQATTRFRY
jgi:DhnA family fructose-bisphosphate aldolase class Ia